MNLNLFQKACAFAALTGVMAVSCDSYKDNETPGNFVEADKDLAGVWQLTQVKRNGVDISNSMDFSAFRLHLNADGGYELENRLPFPVVDDGTWVVDDPAHPFMITFTENGALGAVEVSIHFPNVYGERQLSITHSPGCAGNSYEYLFVKAK